ncbi:unnamed protein product [Cylicostephanus goldi]|uniref:Uncharacterized protein n=1 Tax=Cylicostephanus goldi TaxID=71465 RepID=A0A3P6TRV0_CYLGO|nr:unnamed protein product [Cylicostephanus goldi]
MKWRTSSLYGCFVGDPYYDRDVPIVMAIDDDVFCSSQIERPGENVPKIHGQIPSGPEPSGQDNGRRSASLLEGGTVLKVSISGNGCVSGE